MSEHHVLLLTDIVDSTRLNGRLGDVAMATLWQAHDQAARELLRLWRGREIRRSDGFLLLFAGSDDALGFAGGYHQALAALTPPLHARVGLHRGPVTLRENSAADRAQGAPAWELDGVALPVAARVMDIARGGQTLLSAAVRHGVEHSPARLHGHGFWRLKGVDEPLEIFEAGDAHTDFVPPPDSAKAHNVVRDGDLWLLRRHVRHTLPAERDSFVGRMPQLQELAARFDAGARLVSVLGTGGTGKTRLAQRFGWQWLGAFPGGVWFCDLAPARSVDGIALAVAKGLELPLGGGDPLERIEQALGGRGDCLVVLDNFEQVVRHADETLGRWLGRVARVRFLVTTREVLGLPGETVLNLSPLPPDDSAMLFRQRAEAASAGMAAAPDDGGAIDALVRLLDGLPLAIELAAVRVRVMAPQLLLQRMSERFKMLTAGGARQDRQATLRRTFDWSWDLLAAAEKVALAQLSVFEGGFSLAAAEAVLHLPGDAWAVDVVQALVEKSLLREGRSRRFEMLQSVQEYAAEHLATPGRYDGSGPEAQADAQRRHWRHFAGTDAGNGADAALAEGGADIDNLVAACQRATVAGDAVSACGALAGAWRGLRISGPFRAAPALAAPLLADPALGAAERATAAWVAGAALALLGDGDAAMAHFATGLALARDAGAAALEADLLLVQADLQMTQGRLDGAGQSLQRVLALAEGDARAGTALRQKAHNGLGALALEQGRGDDARRHWDTSLALAVERGDARWQGGVLTNLGTLHHSEGRLDEAERHYLAALDHARAIGDRRWEGSARCNLALALHEQGRHGPAREQLHATLALAHELGDARLANTALCNLGLVEQTLGQTQAAREHIEEAVAGCQATGDRRSEGQFRGYLGGLLLARGGHAAEAAAHLARADALLRAGADPLSLGLLLCQRTQALVLAGDTPSALATLAEAEALLQGGGGDPATETGRALAQARQACGVTAPC